MKKIITILLFYATLFTVACEKKEGDFTIDPNGTITAYKGTAEDLVIPAQINDVQVTAIWGEVFMHKGLSSVTIPDSVVYIGRNAFSGNQLSSVIIPEGVTVISDFVFDKNQLNYVTIPSSVISIGNNAFSGNKLTSVAIPEGVTSIGDEAFYGNHLTSVIIPEGVTSIGNSAFYGNQLTSVIIPDGVKSIGNSAFFQNRLTSVTIPASVMSIGDSAFASNQLSFVTIPDSVTRIGDSAFARNILTSVTIPDGITSIGNNAFARNDLISVIIPNNVTSIGEKAFDSNKLTSVTILANLVSLRGNVFENNPLTTLTIGDGISLGNDVYISDLTSVVLGKDARFGAGVFGYTAYYEYLYNGRKAGTYTAIRNKNSDVDEDFVFIKTRYGAVIIEYRGDEQNLQAIPRQIGGMAVIGIGGTFARKNAHRLQLPNGVTFLDKEAYGNITTRTLTGKAIYFNKLIENDDRVNYAMGEESNNYKLGLIGWTNTGLVAYLKYEWGYMWIDGIRLIIYDAVKNSVTEGILKNISNDIDDYEPILPPEDEIRATLKNWNDALAKHDFTERINKFNIRFDTVKPSPFPYVQGSSSWDCHFEAVVEEPIDEQPWNEPAIVKWNLLASNGSQTKIVASGAEESKGGMGMGGAYAGSNVIGYYKSPFENRLLVAIAHYTAEFEGEIHRWVHLYGFHLSF